MEDENRISITVCGDGGCGTLFFFFFLQILQMRPSLVQLIVDDMLCG